MKKIAIILAFVIILPVAFLVFKELSTLGENEKVLERMYNDQLQAVLFSVNQYSADVVGTWANNLSEITKSKSNEWETKFKEFFDSNISTEIIYLTDPGSERIQNFYFKYKEAENDSIKSLLSNILDDNKQLVNRLFGYEKGGYRKLEPLSLSGANNLGLILFAESESNENRITGMVINQREFITKVLSPRLQEITKNDFIITCRNPVTGFQFNSIKSESTENIQMEKPFWLFPEYFVGIALMGKTIEDIVNERALNDIIIISILFIVLIGAGWIVYRTIKKEVEFAQIKSDFASNVSHELRTPLALISMFAETLEMGRVKTEEKKKEYYTIISQEANRLGRIVNTILNFSRMDAGKRKFNFSAQDINGVAVDIYQNYSFHLHNKEYEFEFEPGIDLPKISLDPEAVSEALVNLIDNAIKYSAEVKFVKLITGKENGFVYVEVQDKGIGISPEDQKKVFDKFFRVSTGLVHSAKGTGLGLSLVKQIMDAHKGKIILNSKPGEGTSFKLLFPINSNNNNGEKNG